MSETDQATATEPGPTEGEWPGVVASAVVEVQCIECGEIVQCELDDAAFSAVTDGGLAELSAECRPCSVRLGTLRAVIPVVVLAGEQVTVIDDHAFLVEWLEANAADVYRRFLKDAGEEVPADGNQASATPADATP